MIFQTLGSQYSAKQVWRHLFRWGRKSDLARLSTYLENKYGGRVFLFDKSRNALATALKQLGRPDGAVVINAFTCNTVVESVKAAGLKVIYADVDENSLNYSAATLATIIKNEPVVAVVVQNSLGVAADIDKIVAVAKKNKLVLIEDLAHCAGLKYANGQEAGTIGDVVAWSFGKDKVLDVVNGGALLIRDPEWAKTFRSGNKPGRLIDSVRDRLYPLLAGMVRGLYRVQIGKVLMVIFQKLGLIVKTASGGIDFNVGLKKWKAQLILEQLQTLDNNHQQRLAKFRQYQDQLKCPVFGEVEQSMPIRVALTVNNRQQVLDRLLKRGIDLRDVWYKTPIAPERFYRQLDFPEVRCPNAVKLAQQIINLPTHRKIKSADIQVIAKIINEENQCSK